MVSLRSRLLGVAQGVARICAKCREMSHVPANQGASPTGTMAALRSSRPAIREGAPPNVADPENDMNNRTMTPARFLALALSASALVLGGCASATDPDEEIGTAEEMLSESKCPADMPAILNPGADQRLAFVLHGDGDQVYQCKAAGAGFAWTLLAPDADLLNPGGDV